MDASYGSGRDGVSAGCGSSGRLAVLSCPPPLCPHAEFAISGVLETPVGLRWSPQTHLAGTLRAAADWHAAPGTAARLAAALRRLGPVVFEVTEEPSPGCDGERYCYSPQLGVHRATLAADGDTVVSESRLRDLLARVGRLDAPAAGVALAHALGQLLGDSWDEQLEPLRAAADGHPVGSLRRTG